jgi:hypothetical protein
VGALAVALAAAVHPFSPTPITRSADHHYFYQGQVYPGVTSILRVIDKSDALMAWAARQTAEAAIALTTEQELTRTINALERLIETVGPEGAIKALTNRSTWKRDEAANLGIEVHRLADLVVNGQPTPSMEEPVRYRVLEYAKWWEHAGWTVRASEAMVVNTQQEYGGTIDLLARDRDGRTVLADIKTGKAVYREAVLQLTAYGSAPLIQLLGRVYSMPKIDRHVILHVTLDGVREVEVPIGALEEMAFAACRALYDWAETTKGKRL